MRHTSFSGLEIRPEPQDEGPVGHGMLGDLLCGGGPCLTAGRGRATNLVGFCSGSVNLVGFRHRGGSRAEVARENALFAVNWLDKRAATVVDELENAWAVPPLALAGRRPRQRSADYKEAAGATAADGGREGAQGSAGVKVREGLNKWELSKLNPTDYRPLTACKEPDPGSEIPIDIRIAAGAPASHFASTRAGGIVCGERWRRPAKTKSAWSKRGLPAASTRSGSAAGSTSATSARRRTRRTASCASLSRLWLRARPHIPLRHMHHQALRHFLRAVGICRAGSSISRISRFITPSMSAILTATSTNTSLLGSVGSGRHTDRKVEGGSSVERLGLACALWGHTSSWRSSDTERHSYSNTLPRGGVGFQTLLHTYYSMRMYIYFHRCIFIFFTYSYS